MTTEQPEGFHLQQRAPQAPAFNEGLSATTPMGGVQRLIPANLPSRPAQRDPDENVGVLGDENPTEPDLDALRANQAVAEARADANLAQNAAAVATSEANRANRSVAYIREHRRGFATGAAVVAAVALCGICGLLNEGRIARSIRGFLGAYPATPTPGAASGGFKGPEYACGAAVDSGPLLNGGTVNTMGKAGAIVDDTVGGNQTEVAVIPPNTVVTLSGAVRDWVYPTDCTIGQITQQAKDHAAQAGFTYESDYHSLDGLGSTGSAKTTRIPIVDARPALAFQARLAENKAPKGGLPWRR